MVMSFTTKQSPAPGRFIDVFDSFFDACIYRAVSIKVVFAWIIKFNFV
jgi:hypothetical protein